MNALTNLIELSRKEFQYLIDADFLAPAQRDSLLSAGGQGLPSVKFTISSVEAEEFRDLFTDELAKVGFDEAYQLTEEGRLLESLIDRFQLF